MVIDYDSQLSLFLDYLFYTVYLPQGNSWEKEFTNSCKYFQNAVRGKVNANGQKFVFVIDVPDGYDSHSQIVKCYAREFKECGINAKFLGPGEVVLNDTVMIFDNRTRDSLEQKFNIQYLGHSDIGNADWLYIQSAKNKPDI